MDCPRCGASGESSSWCTSCGGPLTGAKCRSCSEALRPGAANCGGCGATTTLESAGASNRGPLMVLGGAALVTAGYLWFVAPSTAEAPVAAPAPAGIAAPPPPAAAGVNPGANLPVIPASSAPPSPRGLADKAFNEAMMAHESGLPEAKAKVAAAIAAYQGLPELDSDGLFHLAALQQAAADHAGSVQTAQRILDGDPQHVLALGVAMECHALQGDTERAQSTAERLLVALPAASGKALPEYQEHARMFPFYEQRAREVLQ